MKKTILIILLLLMVLTGCTNKNSKLSCTYTDSYNVTYKKEYTFKDGIIATINQTILTPKSMVQNPDTYISDYKDVNDNVEGCEASYKEENAYYVSNYKCDINIISDENALRIFAQNKDSLKYTRKEIINFHNSEEPGENGKKTICK